MIIIHADTDNGVKEVNRHIEQGKDVFLLIYMDGCGPCNATKPEWKKMEQALSQQYKNNNNLVIADVNSKVVSSLKHAGEILGFPTIMYLSSNGKQMELYENSSIKDKRRDVDCFINWVESHVGNFYSVINNTSRSNTLKNKYTVGLSSRKKYSRHSRKFKSISKSRSRSRSASKGRSRSRSKGRSANKSRY